MPRQKITVDVCTPDWRFCNCRSEKNRKCKTGEMCRFCKEEKKRGEPSRFYCLLFNIELSTKNGMIEKSPLCSTPWGKNLIVNSTAEPKDDLSVSPKEVKKQVAKAIKSVQKTTEKIIEQGLPSDKALELAASIVMDQW